MKLFILTLFPEEIRGFFLKGIFKKAQLTKCFDIEFISLRKFGVGKHLKVDDYPFGHRKGLILRADVLYQAIMSIDHYQDYRLLYTCPKGPVFNQGLATEYTKDKGLVIIPGYYEGVDERIFELLPIERISLGDFILSSGELAALTIAESVLRLLPGVVGNPDCIAEDSIVSGVLQAPEYTQPREVNGLVVPDVLVNGHHQKIQDWRRKMALKETLMNKPELFIDAELSKDDQALLVDQLKEA